MHVHGPGEALQIHLRQYDWMKGQENNPLWVQFCRGLVYHETDALYYQGHAMWEDLTQALNEATTYYVGDTVRELMISAAELAEPEPLFPTDLPSKAGLMLFEHPLQIPDDITYGNGEPMEPVVALMWRVGDVGRIQDDGTRTVGQGIGFTCYAASNSPTVPLLGLEFRCDLGWHWDTERSQLRQTAAPHGLDPSVDTHDPAAAVAGDPRS